LFLYGLILCPEIIIRRNSIKIERISRFMPLFAYLIEDLGKVLVLSRV